MNNFFFHIIPQITESGTEFGNAYKLKSECPEATAVEQHNERTPVCTDYFTGENSPLKYVKLLFCFVTLIILFLLLMVPRKQFHWNNITMMK